METKYPRAVTIQQKALAVLRIFVGLCFLYAMTQKLGPEFLNQFPKQALAFANGNPLGFMVDLLKNLVVPNSMFFGYLLILSEALVGICLVLGLFTAPMGVWGALIALSYLGAYAGKGIVFGGLFLTFAVLCGVLTVSWAGCTWGIDRKLLDRSPWWLQSLFHYEYREF
jgi:uncharacterized membrane protein YphA (DoxX/SURF4 family)